jgi:hypothetical protein
MKLKSRVAVCHSIDAAGRGLKCGRPAWPDGARMTTHGTGMGHGGWLPTRDRMQRHPPIKSPPSYRVC